LRHGADEVAVIGSGAGARCSRDCPLQYWVLPLMQLLHKSGRRQLILCPVRLRRFSWAGLCPLRYSCPAVPLMPGTGETPKLHPGAKGKGGPWHQHPQGGSIRCPLCALVPPRLLVLLRTSWTVAGDGVATAHGDAVPALSCRDASGLLGRMCPRRRNPGTR
jgi:hypothetical protein